MEEVVPLLFEDPYLKAADIAAIVEQPVGTIYNALRRLRYKVEVLRSEVA